MGFFAKYKVESLVAVLTLLGAALRFWELDGFSLTNDELSALWRVRFDSALQVIAEARNHDNHPAGVALLLWWWKGLAGDSAFAVRFPFALAGTLAIPLTYSLGKRWFNQAAGLAAAAALALLHYPVLYSRVARPYAIGLLLTLLAAWALTHFLHSDGRKRVLALIGFAVAAAACAYTHYFAALLAFIMGLSGLLLARGKARWLLAAAGLGAALLFAPHLSLFVAHLSKGGLSEWLGPPGPAFALEHIWYGLNQSWWVVVGVVALLAVWQLTVSARAWNRMQTVALLWFVAPLAIGFVYSIAVAPVIQHSMLLFSFPYFLLLVFSGLPATTNRLVLGGLGALVVLLGGSTVLERALYQGRDFGVFEQLVKKTVEWEAEYPGQITRVANVNNPYSLAYYLQADTATHPFERKKVELADVAAIHELVRSCETPYFQYLWSSRVNAEEIESIILHYYPQIVREERHFNSETVLYGRGEATQRTTVASLQHTFTKQQEGFTYPNTFWKAPDFGWEKGFERMLPEAEYSTVFEQSFADWAGTDAQRNGLTAECFVNGYLTADAEAVLVFTISRNNEQLCWYGREFRDFIAENGSWQPVFLARHLPTLKPTDMLKLYVWNRGKKEVWIDDLRLELIAR